MYSYLVRTNQLALDNIIVFIYNSGMNWITTNIRLPEEDYMELKLTAARQRTSVSALIREKVGVGKKTTRDEKFWKKLDEFAKILAQQNPGVSLSQKLIEMRYEQ